MDVSESQALFLKFAEPLTSYAAFSAERRQLADMLAQNLWKALIAGPQAEDTIWYVLWHSTTGMSDAELASLGFRRIAGSGLIYRHTALSAQPLLERNAAIEPSITAMPASLNSVGVIISRRREKLVRNVAMFEQECAP